MTGATHERQGLLRQTGSLAEEEAFSQKGTVAVAADDAAEEWGLYGGNCLGWHLRPAVSESLQLSLFWLLVWAAKLSFATLCLLPTLLSAHTSLVTLFPLTPPAGAAPPYSTADFALDAASLVRLALLAMLTVATPYLLWPYLL